MKHITSQFHIVRIIVMVAFQLIFHSQCLLSIKVPNFSNARTLVFNIRSKAAENFHVTVLLLFYNLRITGLTKAEYSLGFFYTTFHCLKLTVELTAQFRHTPYYYYYY
jgi:hypothetical protein